MWTGQNVAGLKKGSSTDIYFGWQKTAYVNQNKHSLDLTQKNEFWMNITGYFLRSKSKVDWKDPTKNLTGFVCRLLYVDSKIHWKDLTQKNNFWIIYTGWFCGQNQGLIEKIQLKRIQICKPNQKTQLASFGPKLIWLKHQRQPSFYDYGRLTEHVI